MKPMGRKPKLTPELQEKFLEFIGNGSTISTACRASRISKSTFFRWKERAQQEASGPYVDFFDAITRTEAEVEIRLSEAIYKEITEKMNGKLALDWLARRSPQEWAPPAKQIRVIDPVPTFTVTLGSELHGNSSPVD